MYTSPAVSLYHCEYPTCTNGQIVAWIVPPIVIVFGTIIIAMFRRNFISALCILLALIAYVTPISSVSVPTYEEHNWLWITTYNDQPNYCSFYRTLGKATAIYLSALVAMSIFTLTRGIVKQIFGVISIACIIAAAIVGASTFDHNYTVGPAIPLMAISAGLTAAVIIYSDTFSYNLLNNT